MPMFFLDNRAQVICNELKKEAVHQKVVLSSWEMKKGNFVTPADALASPAPFTPFDGRTMHWYGPDEHYWFRTDMTVPESFDGKTLSASCNRPVVFQIISAQGVVGDVIRGERMAIEIPEKDKEKHVFLRLTAKEGRECEKIFSQAFIL